MSSKKKDLNTKTCMKCKASIKNNVFIKCSACHLELDIKCAAINSKNILAMTKEQKQKWKCVNCLSKQKKPTSSVENSTYSSPDIIVNRERSLPSSSNPNQHSNMSPEMVTMRKKKKEILPISPRSAPDTDEDSFISNSSILRRSLPDLSTRVNEEVDELKIQIQNLKLDLESAHTEIENLIIEKNSLLKQISDRDMKINALTTITYESSPIKTTKKKKKIQKIQEKASITGNDVINKNKTQTDNPQLLEKSDSPILPQYLKKSTDENSLKREALHIEKSNIILPGKNKCDQQNNTNKILIYGSQRCIGLASALLQSRQNSRYEKYSVFSETKPNAPTEEVLKACTYAHTAESTKVILCIGENDTNPTKVILELGVALKHFQKCQVLILSVLCNDHINEELLNRNLRLICNNYKNCHFICNDITYKNYLSDICRKINFCIDSLDYERLYLDVKTLKKRLLSTPPNRSSRQSFTRSPKLQQKTILHYFSKKQEPKPHEASNSSINNDNFFR